MTAANHNFPLPSEIIRIGEALRSAGGRPVLVGGWVRDHLLGEHNGKDFDLEVFALAPEKLQKLLAKFGPVHAVGRQFGVLHLSTREAEYDVSVPRRESKTGKGHKGFWVQADPGMSFEHAAARRDFTINAMGYAYLEDLLLDPHGGQADLGARLLRHVGPAFGEDPLRVMRAMQFAGRFAFSIAPETLAICRAQDLSELPRERMWEEFKKLLLRSPAPSKGLAYAGPLGILPHFPELQQLVTAGEVAPGEEATRTGAPDEEATRKRAPDDPWQVTMAVVDQMARLLGDTQRENLVLMLAALCSRMQSHRMARPRAAPPPEAGPKPPEAKTEPQEPPEPPVANTEHQKPSEQGEPPEPQEPPGAFLERLTNEPAIINAVLALVRERTQPTLLYTELLYTKQLYAGREAGQDSAVRRLALRVGIAPLQTLARACHLAGMDRAADGPVDAPYPAGDWLLQRAESLGVLQGPPEPLLKGRHLQALGFPAGRAMGLLLKMAFELQLDGELITLEQARAWAGEKLAAMPGRAGAAGEEPA